MNQNSLFYQLVYAVGNDGETAFSKRTMGNVVRNVNLCTLFLYKSV